MFFGELGEYDGQLSLPGTGDGSTFSKTDKAGPCGLEHTVFAIGVEVIDEIDQVSLTK